MKPEDLAELCRVMPNAAHEALRERVLDHEHAVTRIARDGDTSTCAAALALLVEMWRMRLGLRSWAAHALAVAPSSRRSGRTTRGLLGAMAEAVVRDMPLSITCGSSDSHGERYCVRLARDMASTLGLREFLIKPERIAQLSDRPRVMYVDHFDDRCPTE